MATTRTSGPREIALWTAQVLLAAVFLFAGGFKLLAPSAQLAQQSPLPPAFLKFVACCEVLGAVGLVLPGLLRVWRGLTPLAASGLAIIMVGAVITTLATQPAKLAILPAVTFVIAVSVARGRWPWRRDVSGHGVRRPAPAA